MRSLPIEPDFASWRTHARRALAEDLKPEDIYWLEAGSADSLFSQISEVSTSPTSSPDVRLPEFRVPKEFTELAELVACVRAPERWALLYRLLYRLTHGEPQVLWVAVDPDVHLARAWAKSVSKDIHKFHAFVRFKSVATEDGERFVAWHRPEHRCSRLAVPFFVNRFGDRSWSIFTPDESAHWNCEHLVFSAGVPEHEFQNVDLLDELWKSYYKSIYNPARINLKAMRSELSPKYWSSLPEATIIRDLMRTAPARLQQMAANQNTSAEVDAKASLPELAAAASKCQACPLYAPATQTVFGEGAEGSEIMIVGEQPGNEEDLAGRPFVGPAGRVLDDALAAAGLDRKQIYVTNAVKHFKFEDRGKMRLHKKPSGRESQACRPWLEAEVARVRPRLILALGTTAGTSILGRLPKITEERGRVLKSRRFAADVLLSWHPAAILRSSTEAEKQQRLEQLRDDLTLARALLTRGP